MAEKIKANTLEELVEYLSKRFDVSYAKLARIVVKTANWQKQQMLKDAVEASVNYYENIPGGSYVELVADILNPTEIHYEDKVKIVIVPINYKEDVRQAINIADELIRQLKEGEK